MRSLASSAPAAGAVQRRRQLRPILLLLVVSFVADGYRLRLFVPICVAPLDLKILDIEGRYLGPALALRSGSPGRSGPWSTPEGGHRDQPHGSETPDPFATALRP